VTVHHPNYQMTHNSELRLAEVNAALAGEARKRGLAKVTDLPSVRTMFASERHGPPLGRASTVAFAVFVAGAALSYLAQLVTARIIGPDSYGIYAYVLAWVTLLGYFSTLGFHVSLLRFVPAYQAKEEWALVRGVIQYAFRGAAGTAISVVLIGVGVIIACKSAMSPELANTFLLGLAAVPFLALHLIAASLVRAFGGVVVALAPERVVRDGLLLVIVAATFWGNLYPLDATLAAGATLLGSLVMLGLIVISLHSLRPPNLGQVEPAYRGEEWWRPTLPLTLMMIADNLMSRSGVIALGLVGNTLEAGIFAVAFSMTILTALPRMAVATVFAPTVSALFAREDRAGLQTLSANAACLSMLGTTCVAIPLILLAPTLLAWFGPNFVAGAPIVAILVLGEMFAAACGPQQHLLTMTGHERIGATMLAVCAVSNFAACLLMMDWLGMTGAALARTASLIAWNVAMGVFVHRRLHLAPALLASFRTMTGRKRAPDHEI
jgi:O-antigen/teichoic acid export membrane protein